MKLQLSNGMEYGIGANGEKICRGAKMGRPNILPSSLNTSIKLRMEKLKLVDYDYDSGGAYWGASFSTAIYCAWSNDVQIFVRAESRNAAKNEVRAFLPTARFFN